MSTPDDAASIVSNEDRPCHFWRLPLEIQDMVFEWAFAEQFKGEICFKEEWKFRERQAKKEDGVGYISNPFPSYKVNDFMVSKRFFIEASRAWFSAQRFTEPKFDHDHPGINFGDFVMHTNGLYLQFATHLTISDAPSDLGLLECMQGLRTLHIVASGDVFETIEDKYPYEDIYSTSELRALPLVQMVANMRHLKIISILPELSPNTDPDIQEIYFERNVKALNEAVQCITPKTCSSKAGRQGQNGVSCMPIYYLSEVCLGCNRLHLSPDEIAKSIRHNDIPESKDAIREMMRAQDERLVDYVFEVKRTYGMRSQTP